MANNKPDTALVKEEWNTALGKKIISNINHLFSVAFP